MAVFLGRASPALQKRVDTPTFGTLPPRPPAARSMRLWWQKGIEFGSFAAGGWWAGMLFQHIAWSQSALMRCRARCACSAYATSSEFDAFLPFWLPSAARKGGRCLRRRSGEGLSGRCPSDRWPGLLSRRFPGMRGAFFAALSVSSRQSKKMTCGITKKVFTK